MSSVANEGVTSSGCGVIRHLRNVTLARTFNLIQADEIFSTDILKYLVICSHCSLPGTDILFLSSLLYCPSVCTTYPLFASSREPSLTT